MTDHKAQPKPGTVYDRRGDYCPRARVESYPLAAFCHECGADIRCADGTADWSHVAPKAPTAKRGPALPIFDGLMRTLDAAERVSIDDGTTVEARHAGGDEPAPRRSIYDLPIARWPWEGDARDREAT